MTPAPQHRPAIVVRETRPSDFAGIIDMCRAVYPDALPWGEGQLRSHLEVFPEGQLVAVEEGSGRLAGMAASLILPWDEYEVRGTWKEFTGQGTFRNHDPVNGRTLYGAEVMVHPSMQRRGVGSRIYEARRELARRKGLLRIRAGARLRGYSRYADVMGARDYVRAVVQGEIRDPTLTFQLRHGFRVIMTVDNYLHSDPESGGNAAIIEWLNREVATRKDAAGRDPYFARPHREPSHVPAAGTSLEHPRAPGARARERAPIR